MKDEFRLGKMIGSSSVEDSYGDSSHSSFSEDGGGGSLFFVGSSPTITVSVLAFPLESMVKITSVRGFGKGNSGIEVRLLGRCCFTGEDRPVRGIIRPFEGVSFLLT